MALWICTGCTAAYAVGAPQCPQCGSTERREEGEDVMAKVTVHGGATNADAPEQERGEDVSAGNSSETSSEKESTSPQKSGAGRQKPALKTASRSAKDRTDSSSAPGTDGDQTAPTSDAGDA
ncbi:hypothetical protein [Streptomyces sp. wa1063]|uniref:hypothetical protein n=1 Tax=Streptomyces sp. wa1063 TaxID=1828212 RepID=UPI000BF1C27C|nr:hypothetical protein [Streptomyces sp. wa1063]